MLLTLKLSGKPSAFNSISPSKPSLRRTYTSKFPTCPRLIAIPSLTIFFPLLLSPAGAEAETNRSKSGLGSRTISLKGALVAKLSLRATRTLQSISALNLYIGSRVLVG